MAGVTMSQSSSSRATSAILGNAPAVGELRAQIERLAAFDRPGSARVPTVLVYGETGTGKGLVARVMHDVGPRARGPFIDVNCAAIPESMLEAELFGFVPGAFTDARRAKAGLFEAASGGTLFLDEIDSLTLTLQGKLLKAIEEKQVRRLGAVEARAVDVKVIAATQRDLARMVEDGRFRTDLYHRLAVVVLELPPLRERGDDIVLLGERFLAEHAAAHGIDAKRLTGDAARWLREQPWPGNVRELAHLMERATLLSVGETLASAVLVDLCVTQPGAGGGKPSGSEPVAMVTTPERASQAGPDDEPADEATAIRAALLATGGNVVAAARSLGIGRNALRYRMRRHGIERSDIAPSPPRPSSSTKPSTPASDEARPVAAGTEEASWELKPVAILAVDIELPAADTESTPELEPWTAMGRIFATVEEKIRGFGGVPIQQSPSRLVAAFGVPRALEQSAERAVKAALAVRQAASTGEIRPEIRLAVHFGEAQVDVTVAAPARLLPAGDTVALAERLLGHADDGEILVSSVLARRLVALCELEQRTLHVGRRSIDAFAVIKQRSRLSPGHGLRDETESRFVGREREIDELEEILGRADAGRGQVVFVVGEPGIGKSRLLAEFHRRVGSDRAVWVEGRSAAYATTTAFFAIADGLRRYCEIDDRDDSRAALAKVEGAVRAIDAELAWTVPYLARVLSLETGDEEITSMDSASRRSETFRALQAVASVMAQQKPLIVVVEDLHWIDPDSEEFLRYFSELVPTSRVLLLCSHRPGYRHPFGDRSYHVRLLLRPLPERATEGIVESLMKVSEVSPEICRLISAKAEGNPFFVEEVTRSLIEDGTLRSEQGRAVLTRQPGEVSVPTTIQDVLMARIDRLAADAKRAIQVASVIGREFALRLLERISDAGDTVRTQVEELRTLELVYEKAMHPELAYMFKHALTHDVAYESIVGERRRSLHKTIGHTIEELYADRLVEHYETLAHHFTRAEDWPRALRYHRLAAEKAAVAYANRAVVEHSRAALALLDKPGCAAESSARADLEERLGRALFYLSEYREAGDAYRRAAAASDQDGMRGERLCAGALSYFWGHAYPASKAAIAEAAEIPHTQPLAGVDAMVAMLRAYATAVLQGNLQECTRSATTALAVAEKGARGSEVEGLVCLALGQAAEWNGDYTRAASYCQRSVAIGRRERLAHLVIWPTWFLGKAACCTGDYGRALSELTAAYEICDRIGDRAWKTRLLNTLGWFYAEIESHELARDFNRRAAALADELGDLEIIANAEINLAGNHLEMGRAESADDDMSRLWEGIEASKDPWMRWRFRLHALDMRGRISLAKGDPEAALAHAREELEGARAHGATKLEARALLLNGGVLHTLERLDESRQALVDAAAIADRIGYVRAAWQARAQLAELERREGRAAEAERHVAEHRRLIAGSAASLTDEGLKRRLLAACS